MSADVASPSVDVVALAAIEVARSAVGPPKPLCRVACNAEDLQKIAWDVGKNFVKFREVFSKLLLHNRNRYLEVPANGQRGFNSLILYLILLSRSCIRRMKCVVRVLHDRAHVHRS